jgi:hypothetical protein
MNVEQLINELLRLPLSMKVMARFDGIPTEYKDCEIEKVATHNRFGAIPDELPRTILVLEGKGVIVGLKKGYV